MRGKEYLTAMELRGTRTGVCTPAKTRLVVVILKQEENIDEL